VNGDRGEVAFSKELVEFGCSKSALDENDDLVEFQSVEQVVELSVLLAFVESDGVLLQTVQGQLGLVVDIDFHGVPHEFLADGSDLLREGGTEHHDLLLSRGGTEDLLDVSAHVCTHVRFGFQGVLGKLTNLVKHLVAFIENEVLDVPERKDLVSDQSVKSTRCTNNDVGVLLLALQELDVLGHGRATIEDGRLNLGEVLAKSGVFVLDLVCQLSSVAHDQN